MYHGRMRLTLTSCFGLLVGGFSLTACFEDTAPITTDSGNNETETGDEDPTTGDGDGDPTTGDGDGDPATGDGDGDQCSATQICVEDPVPGWQGPLKLYQGPIAATPPACEGGTPIKIVDLLDDLQTNQAADTCTCACGPLQGATCGSSGFYRSDQANCLGVFQGWNLAPNNCQSLGVAQPSTRFRGNAPMIVGGTCTPQLVQDIVEAEYDTRMVACGVADSAPSCDGGSGVCMDTPQAPFGGQICIAAEGNVQCPAGSSYIDRYVHHTGLQDNRACSSCACDLVEGSKCSGVVRLFSANACASLQATLNLDQCSALIANISHARFEPSANQQGSCDASGGGIQGQIEETGAWTLCCQ
jgi:hypothetical protein